jgi:hypothetical protein
MPSSLEELHYRQRTLYQKLQRLLNLQSMMTRQDKQLDGDITVTRLRLEDVRREIDNNTRR